MGKVNGFQRNKSRRKGGIDSKGQKIPEHIHVGIDIHAIPVYLILKSN
jgi:hypothetical protein